MKKQIFVIFLILTANIVFAGNLRGDVVKKENGSARINTFVLTGKVTDNLTGEALTGVRVTVEGLDETVYTDFDGNYRIDNLVPGEYRVSASLVSYRSSVVEKVETVKTNQQLNIKLHALK